ncbi:MAG: hypothetical protein CMN69_04775 [Sphingomonadaceae bacterium]|nr:hypothetical protein [Sphingomonadaceae bacterium]
MHIGQIGTDLLIVCFSIKKREDRRRISVVFGQRFLEATHADRVPSPMEYHFYRLQLFVAHQSMTSRLGRHVRNGVGAGSSGFGIKLDEAVRQFQDRFKSSQKTKLGVVSGNRLASK